MFALMWVVLVDSCSLRIMRSNIWKRNKPKLKKKKESKPIIRADTPTHEVQQTCQDIVQVLKYRSTDVPTYSSSVFTAISFKRSIVYSRALVDMCSLSFVRLEGDFFFFFTIKILNREVQQSTKNQNFTKQEQLNAMRQSGRTAIPENTVSVTSLVFQG